MYVIDFNQLRKEILLTLKKLKENNILTREKVDCTKSNSAHQSGTVIVFSCVANSYGFIMRLIVIRCTSLEPGKKLQSSFGLRQPYPITPVRHVSPGGGVLIKEKAQPREMARPLILSFEKGVQRSIKLS